MEEKKQNYAKLAIKKLIYVLEDARIVIIGKENFQLLSITLFLAS